MITYEYALEQAEKYLADSEIPLQITYAGEFSDGWYFCYQSKEFLETGEVSAQLAGNGPFLIDKMSGEIHVLGTVEPLQYYLDEYTKDKVAKFG